MLRWQAWNVLRGRRRSQNLVCLVVDEFQGCWVSGIAQQEYGTFPPTTSVLFSVCVCCYFWVSVCGCLVGVWEVRSCFKLWERNQLADIGSVLLPSYVQTSTKFGNVLAWTEGEHACRMRCGSKCDEANVILPRQACLDSDFVGEDSCVPTQQSRYAELVFLMGHSNSLVSCSCVYLWLISRHNKSCTHQPDMIRLRDYICTCSQKGKFSIFMDL